MQHLSYKSLTNKGGKQALQRFHKNLADNKKAVKNPKDEERENKNLAEQIKKTL